MDNEHIKISGCVIVDNRCFNDEIEERCRVREMLAEQLAREIEKVLPLQKQVGDQRTTYTTLMYVLTPNQIHELADRVADSIRFHQPFKL